MTRLLLTCLLLTALCGCSREPGALDEPAATAAARPGTPAEAARSTLAYRHAIRIDVPDARVAAVHDAALAACRAAAAELCTVLESQVSMGRATSAKLRVRAKPAGITKLVAALGKQAAITDQSTTAEDLAGPLQEGEKKLAMLTTYRADLETLRQRAGNDVDKLIKLSHELAQVQSELEAANGKQAYLVQRVETEILEISIRADQYRSFWQPISLALSDFGGSLSQGISTAITGVAYLLPWGLVIGLVAWAGRKLWRRRRQP